MRARFGALLPALLAGCSMAPAYRPPQTVTPQIYKETAPAPDGWTAAVPQDHVPRGRWWEAFGDPVLNDLEMRAAQASPSLAAALARYDQARAIARIDGAVFMPSVGLAGSASRERVSGNRPLGNGTPQTYDDFVVGGTFDYEIDLWGRIRNSVTASRADAAASAADLASARLSLQAAVADAYARLRGLDAEAALLKQTVDAFSKAHDLTAARHEGGIASGLDVNRAKTVLGNARAQVSAVANERAETEHEIAALVGAITSDFAVPPSVEALAVPTLAMGVPSELLQRRPDIAAAERKLQAANARIGVARAALFPTVTLGLNGGWQATQGGLLNAANSFWGLGPLSTVLALFDGGRRRAEIKLSRAQYDELAARYRETVLTAFREVEDGIAANRYLAAQAVDQRAAADAAERTSDLALTRYRDGASDYLQVVTAQTGELDARRAYLVAQTQHIRASIALIKALGGGAGS